MLFGEDFVIRTECLSTDIFEHVCYKWSFHSKFICWLYIKSYFKFLFSAYRFSFFFLLKADVMSAQLPHNSSFEGPFFSFLLSMGAEVFSAGFSPIFLGWLPCIFVTSQTVRSSVSPLRVVKFSLNNYTNMLSCQQNIIRNYFILFERFLH